MSHKKPQNLLTKANKEKIPSPEFTVWGISWTEYESGWGCRPDGWSLHRSQDALKQYLIDYRKSLSKEVPHEYSAPDSEDGKLIVVSEELYKSIHKKTNMRMWQNNPEEFKKIKE